MFRTCLLAALCVALAPTPATPQVSTTHALNGIVRDFTGAVVVGADVALEPLAGGETRRTVTDDGGRFQFGRLPPDGYRVVASSPGFTEASRRINLASQPMAAVELILQILVTEHVDVSATVSAPASAGLASTLLTGTGLEALPDDPGGLLQRVRELAGATDSVGQVIVTIDGFRQQAWLPPKQAIQAIRISSSWFAPEFAEPGQARVDIITKPGLGSIHGDVRLNFNDESLNARNALAPRDPSGHMRDVTAYLSGPVIPGRWSFVLYGGQWAQRQQHVINATVLNPRDLAAERHVEMVSAPSRVDSVWLGTTYQLAPRHTLAVSLSRNTERAENLGLDTGLDLPERAFGREASSGVLRATLTSVPSMRVMNEFRAQAHTQRSMIRSDSSAPAVIVLDAFTSGGNQDALLAANRHVDVEAMNAISVFVPRHTLKAGIDARVASGRYTDDTNAGGVFLFGTDYERDDAGEPIAVGAGDRHLISPLENYRRTLLGVPGYGASQFWMTQGGSDVRMRESSIGAYAQDDWTVASRLTMSYGLRTEWESAASRAGVGPRAGVSVALDAARKNVIRAGAGSFFQRIEPELTLDVMRLDGQRQQQVLVEHPSFFPVVPADVGLTVALPETRVADRDLRAPRIFMSAASYDRELEGGMFVTLKYGYQYGTYLLRTRNINAPDAAGLRADPRSGRVLQYESTGRLRRHEVTSGWRWNPGVLGSVFANYGYVRGRGDTDGRTTLPADGSRLDDEFGPAAADRPHTANIGGHFSLPGAVFVSPYLTAASGHVFNITTGLDNNGDSVFADRPAFAPAGTAGAVQTPYGWLLANRGADVPMVPRNFGREPASLRVDLRVSRAFHYTNGALFVVATGIENMLNRTNFEGVNGVMTSPLFGMPKRAASPRRVNLSAGFSF